MGAPFMTGFIVMSGTGSPLPHRESNPAHVAKARHERGTHCVAETKIAANKIGLVGDMPIQPEEQSEFHDLELRLSTLLPQIYQDRYNEVLPVSMGSAGLKYGDDGKVAWGEIWQSFCDLAMAGGPPHRGTLLEPAGTEDIAADSDRYREVVDEICRGIHLVTGLYAKPSPYAGWVRMYCTSAAMAGWLARAIVMENVSANFKGLELYLPTGPRYRIEKEIKNVITAVAKTCHYWIDHTSPEQQEKIAALFSVMEVESPLLKTALLEHTALPHQQQQLASRLPEGIREKTGLTASHHSSAAWLGIDCGGVSAAVWMMRVLAASNLFTRREETVVFVPLNTVSDPDGEIVLRTVTRAHLFAVTSGIF